MKASVQFISNNVRINIFAIIFLAATATFAVADLGQFGSSPSLIPRFGRIASLPKALPDQKTEGVMHSVEECKKPYPHRLG